MTWHAYPKLVTPALQAFSTPLLGVSNARLWSMSFRNDEQLDLLDLLFDAETDQQGSFFRTVVFECPVEVSLNWTLSDREKEVLSNGFGRAGARPGDVIDYMTGENSYVFHKWKTVHKSDLWFDAELKKKYDKELEKLGCRGMSRMTTEQSRKLYENLVQNLKRLELLGDWWREGHVPVNGAIPRPAGIEP